MLPLIYFVRHGQTDWNAEERLQGQADTDLNETGRLQANRNGKRLAELVTQPDDFDFICSPLRRTIETMERVRAQMGLPADGYHTDERLKEVHFGAWQGFTYAELEAREAGCTQARSSDKWRFVPPGADAESYEILTQRISSWLETVQQPTICVTHGGVIRAVLHLTSQVPADEAANLPIVQDRILRLHDNNPKWL